MNSLIKLLSAIILFIIPFLLPGSDNGEKSLNDIAETIKKLQADFSQQKVYLHTDKDEYIAGENIWIKAYLVNAITHLPDTNSTNLNVKLVNSKGEHISIELLKLKNGYSHADIAIPDSLTEGNYQLRAYTNWMRNFDSELHFNKDIFIANPIEKNYIRFRERRYNRRFNNRLEKKEEQMQFAFFPEGGNLVEDLESNLAFKAVNSLGAGQDITGVIFDNDDNKVIEFNTAHDGMGSFPFKPEQGNSYYATISFPDGQEKKVKLNNIMEEGYVLSVNTKFDKIELKIKSNFDPADYNLSPDIYILAHLRGKTHFKEKATLENNVFQTSIPVDNLPSGISHITIFDSNMSPLSERLVFVNREESVDKADITLQKDRIRRQDGYSVNVSFESIIRDNTEGSYSISVMGADNPFDEVKMNIASYLLLTSDISKTLENPWNYISNPSDEAKEAIDLVMLTHGWRRFNINDVLAGYFPKIEYGIPHGLTLSGEVTAPKSQWRSGKQRVELTVKKDDKSVGMLNTQTDEQGNFAFTGLDYKGIFTAELRVPGDRGQRTLDVELTPTELSQQKIPKTFLTRPHSTTNRGDDWERVSRPKYTIEHLTIRSKREPTALYGNADQTIFMEDVQISYTDMMQVLRTQVRGLNVIGNEIVLRGPSSLLYSNEPLFMVDNSIVGRNYILRMNPNDVERIEVFTGSSTSMFGVRGGNGVIIAHTKTDIPGRDAQIKYTLKGYTTPDEFFHSKIDLEKNINTNIPSTIFWEPYLIPDENGNANIRFPLNENWQHVRIIIEGVDNKGNITFEKYDVN